MSLDDVEVSACKRHPRVLTAVCCSKCGTPICPRCMVQTPVGARCRQCAQIRRLPQFDVSLVLLVRSAAAGLVVSVVAWLLISGLAFLRFFLAILVGVAVGEVMSRLSRRRSNLVLEATAVLVILIGFLLVQVWGIGGNVGLFVAALSSSPAFLMQLLLPVAVASFVAVMKLR